MQVLSELNQSFKCKVCGETFRSEMALRGHQKKHREKKFSNPQELIKDFQEFLIDYSKENENVLLKRCQYLERENKQLLEKNSSLVEEKHGLEKENVVLKWLLGITWTGISVYGMWQFGSYLCDWVMGSSERRSREYMYNEPYNPVAGLLSGLVEGVGSGLKDGVRRKVSRLIA